MILNNGKLNVDRLLGGHVDGKKITHLVVGTSSTPVDPADTTIAGALVKAVSDVQYLPGGITKFVAELDAADPAMTIWEVGLKNEDGVLVHRKVFDTAQVKVAGLAFRVTYSVKVS
jgi:hypothetical protein